MDRIVKYGSEHTLRAPHYDLYAQWKRNEILLQDTNVGYGITDTFTNVGDETIGIGSGWADYADTGCTINGVGGSPGIQFVTDTTDNDEVWVQSGSDAGTPFVISDTAGSNKQLIFCAEFKVSSIADSGTGVYIGLGTAGMAAADTITDAGALKADEGFIGFFRPEGDGDGLDFIYQAASQTMQTHISDAVTLVADTYITVGFKFDGSQIHAFYNGSFNTDSPITATNIAAATFPDDEAMGILMGHKNGAAAAHTTTVRFVECQQYV